MVNRPPVKETVSFIIYVNNESWGRGARTIYNIIHKDDNQNFTGL